MTRVRLIGISAALAACLVLVAGCAGPSLKEDLARPAADHAKPPATEGVLAEIAARTVREHGPEASAFKVLDGSKEALDWRLALIS